MLSTSFPHLACFQERALEVYLLPGLPWEQALALQQRLVFEASDAPRNRASLLLAEHLPLITVGRQGSRAHILVDDDELRRQEVAVRWTNRGGGCWLHGAGQLVAYPIVPLRPPELGLDAYRDALYAVIEAVLSEFHVTGQRMAGGVAVGGRVIAAMGIAVKDWVTYHGCWLNVHPSPDRFDWVRPIPNRDLMPTSLFRELRTPIRADAVRESFLRHFRSIFGFRDHYLCHLGAATLARKYPSNLAAQRR